MGKLDIHNDNYISFKEDTHQYFDPNGVEYTSMSRVLDCIKEPFDRERISMAIAKRDGLSQQQVLDQWDLKKDNSIDYGNLIHNGLEDYLNLKKVKDKRIRELGESFSNELTGYYKVNPEQTLYDKEHLIAGQTDLLLDRQKVRSGDQIIDLDDYKTNLEKGIYFDSIWRKNGQVKHLKKYLLAPLDHLEECNYNLYSLQLSGYAYMAEKTYGVKIGKLFIVWIRYDEKSDSLYYTMIPVPYMKLEIIALFNHFRNLKKL